MTEINYGSIVIRFTDRQDQNQRDKNNRPSGVIIPNQKHTTVVVRASEDISTEADGLYTDRPGVAIGVLTADCMPVVMFNDHELAVVHAGWRGLFGGILQNAISMFSRKPDRAFIGPSIRQCCYEVGKDFVENLKIPEKYWKVKNSRFYLSLHDVAVDILQEGGIQQVHQVEECTACSGRYFSYRKGDFDDRILTYAYIRG